MPVEEDRSSGTTFTIGAALDPDQEKALVKFFCSKKEVFAWEPKQLVGVPREVIEHHLKVCPNVRPVKQKARRQSMEKQAFIVQGTRMLEAAGVIREVRYPEWLANPVVVPKRGGKSVGDRSKNLKFYTHHQDQSMESSSNEREECIYIPL